MNPVGIAGDTRADRRAPLVLVVIAFVAWIAILAGFHGDVAYDHSGKYAAFGTFAYSG